MAIANVVQGTDITAAWGNSVADTVNPTAWTVLAYAASWVGGASNPAKYRMVGDIVYVQGAVQWNGGTVADTGQTVATMPVGFRPLTPRRFVCWFNNSGIAKRASVDANGVITIDTPLAASQNFDISLIYSTTV